MKYDVNEIKNNNDESFRYKELLMKKENDINEQTDRIINIGLNAVSIIGPIVLYNIWMKRGFEFDEDSRVIKEGKLKAIYFKGSFGGFDMHLVQK